MSRVSFTIKRNDISPKLSAMAKTARHPRSVLLAMGNVFKSITVGNFNSAGASMRPLPWPAKRDGTPATLKKSGLLWHSFNLEVTDQYAKLSNPTPYAARHQFGDRDYTARKKGANMPPRPFVPVRDGKLTPEAEKLIEAAGHRAMLREIGE